MAADDRQMLGEPEPVASMPLSERLVLERRLAQCEAFVGDLRARLPAFEREVGVLRERLERIGGDVQIS